MSPRHVVVDGSNIATEGRSLPSLAQLDQAVREFLAENPDDIVTVVVDASFGHRIEPSELQTFEEAESAAELVSPPAGAIGRGDAFLLRIAEKTGATVLSNDSFQEFHGEHEWLFDKGRLIGGKPVPGVGWIFTPRTPVRGPKSREAVKEARRRQRSTEIAEGASGLDLAAARGGGRGRKVEKAIATATDEATGHSEGTRRRRRRTSEPPSEPVNPPLTFINFIAAHRLASTVTGTVEAFSSHGAFVTIEGATCYLPLSAMADPPPNRAREVVSKGEQRTFVVQAFDPLRRGVELAIPGFEHIAAGVTEETVEAEIAPLPEEEETAATSSRRPSRQRGRTGAGAAGAEPEAVGTVRAGAVGAGTPAQLPRSGGRASPSVAGEPTPDAPLESAPPRRRSRSRKLAAPAAEAASEAASDGGVAAGAGGPAGGTGSPADGGPAEGAPAKRVAAKGVTAKGAGRQKAAAEKAASIPEEGPVAGPVAGPAEAAGRSPAKKAAPGKAPAGAGAAKRAPAVGAPADGTTAKKALAGGTPAKRAAKEAPAEKAASSRPPAGKRAVPSAEAGPARMAVAGKASGGGAAVAQELAVSKAPASRERPLPPANDDGVTEERRSQAGRRSPARRRPAAAAHEGAGTATGRAEGGSRRAARPASGGAGKQ